MSSDEPKQTTPDSPRDGIAGAPAWGAWQKFVALFVFVVLPIGGLILNRSLGPCRPCEEGGMLAEPEIYGFYVLYACVVFVYAISRSRPERLPPMQELLVFAGMICGVALSILLMIHFGPMPVLAPVAFISKPMVFVISLPLVAPHFVCLMLLLEIRRRALRRGREGPPRVALQGLWLSPALLGIYAVAMAAWRGAPDAGIHVFTRTCVGTLATLQVPPCHDGHYLCTVAAQGHPWLVRPQRWGRRGGRPIIVNRQLAVANAFEDLLHERWPRFGRLARRTYDRVGLPISRYLRRRWMADLCYLAMKPAEWGFLLVLLLLDRKPPEDRIARMYR